MLRLKPHKNDVDPVSVGIDIHADGIALALRRKGKPSTIKCEFIPVRNQSEIPQALKAAVDKHRLKKQHATVLMPSNLYNLLQTSSPALRPEELRAAARWKINELLPYPVENAVVDVFEYPKAGQRGTERMLYVVAANRADVQREVDWLQQSDLTLKSIDIGEFALRNVVSLLPENESGTIVLSLTEHQGLLVFVKQDEVYLARRLEFGYNDLLLGEQNIRGDLVLELQRSMDFFESQFAQPMPPRLLVYPPDKLTSELTQHIYTELNIQVEPLILERLAGYKLDLDAESQSRCLLAVGAALREEEEAAV
ncbi:MAG TPA: pilus assembly protein PilM [Gammaproteobacteria bacterium]|nr:pilus assembly protein PilM [Gammaproteobacteria bacterium]